jgi:hypothetical protein
MTLSKKRREKLINDKVEDFKQTGVLLAELQAGIEPAKESATPPSTGKKLEQDKVSFHLNINKKLHEELRQIAFYEKSSITALLLEGLATVLQKRGKSINDYLD